jgi:hypothetical protein
LTLVFLVEVIVFSGDVALVHRFLYCRWLMSSLSCIAPSPFPETLPHETKAARACESMRSRVGLKSRGSTPTIRASHATILPAATGCSPDQCFLFVASRDAFAVWGKPSYWHQVKPYPNIYCGTICQTAYIFSLLLGCNHAESGAK